MWVLKKEEERKDEEEVRQLYKPKTMGGGERLYANEK